MAHYPMGGSVVVPMCKKDSMRSNCFGDIYTHTHKDRILIRGESEGYTQLRAGSYFVQKKNIYIKDAKYRGYRDTGELTRRNKK